MERAALAIDNGLCFHEGRNKLRTVIWEYAGMEVESHLSSGSAGSPRVTSVNVANWLNPTELALAQVRAHGLVENALYPEPDETSDWPPYPWPLI